MCHFSLAGHILTPEWDRTPESLTDQPLAKGTGQHWAHLEIILSLSFRAWSDASGPGSFLGQESFIDKRVEVYKSPSPPGPGQSEVCKDISPGSRLAKETAISF